MTVVIKVSGTDSTVAARRSQAFCRGGAGLVKVEEEEEQHRNMVMPQSTDKHVVINFCYVFVLKVRNK